MDMENNKDIIQPLSEEEMAQAIGGAATLQPGQYLECKVCGTKYSGDKGDEVPYYSGFCKCSRCGGSLKYTETERYRNPVFF